MSKEMVISANPHETRVAILEEGQLCEYYVEREKEFALVGSIYKGKVTRVLPGMQSAFVEIGLDSDAFLYVSDFMEEIEELDHVVTPSRTKPRRWKIKVGRYFPRCWLHQRCDSNRPYVESGAALEALPGALHNIFKRASARAHSRRRSQSSSSAGTALIAVDLKIVRRRSGRRRRSRRPEQFGRRGGAAAVEAAAAAAEAVAAAIRQLWPRTSLFEVCFATAVPKSIPASRSARRSHFNSVAGRVSGEVSRARLRPVRHRQPLAR